MESTRTVEINGVKMDIDFSKATRIDEFRIGDNVKILRKAYGGYEVLPGVIVDFANFKNLPTIVIATIIINYGSASIEFLHYNAKTEDLEITATSDIELRIEKSSVVEKLNKEIKAKQDEIETLISKRDWFLKFYAGQKIEVQVVKK